MNYLKSLDSRTRALLGINLLMIAILLVSWVVWRRQQSDPSVDHWIELKMAEQTKATGSLLNLSLDKVRLDTRALADLTTHIFSHPESYQLSAQPGEYDYNGKTGVYGSLRDDGLSVAFLSSLTPLTPALLKEIRLSEYLNPVFQTLLRSNPGVTRVSLLTANSLLRSCPWFDFSDPAKSGKLKKDFQASNSFLWNEVNPAHNPKQGVVCGSLTTEWPEPVNRVQCAGAFFMGEQFHGMLVVEVDPFQFARKSFDDTELRDWPAVLVDRENRVLGLSPPLEAPLPKAGGDPAPFLKNLRSFPSPKIESLLAGLQLGASYSGRFAGGYLQVLPLNLAALRLVAFLPPSLAEGMAAGESVRSQMIARRWPIWLSALTGLLLLVNSWSLWKSRSAKMETGIEDEIRGGLLQLRLEETKAAPPPASDVDIAETETLLPPLVEAHELLPLDEVSPLETETLPFEMEATSAEKPPTETSLAETTPAELIPAVTSPAETIAFQSLMHQVSILSCFDAVGPIGAHLSRLGETLQNIFSVRRAVFLLYFPEDRTFRSLSDVTLLGENGILLKPLEIKADGWLDESKERRPGFVSNNATWTSGGDWESREVVKRNYLLSPLYSQDRMFGALLLVDKDSEFTSADLTLIHDLQDSLVLTLRNLYQCEGLTKIDQLRREYCVELSKAVELTLERIQEEVQEIYSRLARVSPLQKKNCDAILFEVGRLMEVAREVNEFEPANEGQLPSPLSESTIPEVPETERMQ
ncbi:MAG: hypothetical protein U0V70_04865 [Terriglobia bacterium]